MVTSLLHWPLVFALVLAGLFWLLVLYGTWRENAAQKWVLKAAAVLPAGPRPMVSIVVPARNEERNLQALLDSVRALEWPELEVIVIDDRSTDRTPAILAAAVAADPRVKSLRGTDLPSGWMGKSWALHQAVASAKGQWLLFLDADVTVDPRALRQAMDWAHQREVAMLSGYGFLRLESFWEKVIMPVLGGMIVGANPLDEVNDPAHARIVCNGQFILIARSAYDAIGGHAAVKGEIIDDMALAREAKAKKIRYRMIFCRELFRTRMYTTLREIWDGWTKNLFAALGYRPGVALGVVGFILVTAVIPAATVAGALIGRLASGRAWDNYAFLDDEVLILAAASTGLMFGYRIYASVIFDQDWKWFWTHPLGALVTAGIFANSAWLGLTRRTVRWKGRDYGAAGPAA